MIVNKDITMWLKYQLLFIALVGSFSSVAYADDMSDLIFSLNNGVIEANKPPELASINPYISRQNSINNDSSLANNFSLSTERLDSQTFHQRYNNVNNIKPEHIDILYQAEKLSTPAAKAVLIQVRKMALDEQIIIKGSCWDYLNSAFGQAMVNREKVFVGEYPKGPFINTADIKAGDWLYYVNHSYHDIQHSGLFVGWVDQEQNKALILSYAGESRREPARYKVYDLSHTYNVMRPVLP